MNFLDKLFTDSYVKCALWSTTDYSTEQGGEPLDDNYCAYDIEPETMKQMVEDCEAFRNDNWADLETSGLTMERAGHNFWLNRNGHGSGFWDEYFGPDEELRAAFKRLSEASKVWGTFSLYVGDDGQIKCN